MTCTVALSTSRTRTMLGSNLTARVVIGDALADLDEGGGGGRGASSTVRWRSASPLRVTSVPASGRGASNWASIWAVLPGGTCSSGPDQVTRTARSGSLALSCRCAHSFPPGCRRRPAPSRSCCPGPAPGWAPTSRVTGGSSIRTDGRLLERDQRLDVPRCRQFAVMVSGRVSSWPGSGWVAVTREDDRRRAPGPDLDDRRIEVNRTACSASEPENRSSTGRLLRELSTTTVHSAVSRSRTRSSRGSARSSPGRRRPAR